MTISRRLRYSFVLLLCAFSAGAQVPDPAADPVAAAIGQQFDEITTGGSAAVRGVELAMTQLALEFYQQRQFRSAWDKPVVADQLRKALAGSHEEGLDPNDYYVPLLETLSAEVRTSNATTAVRAQYDILMTEALLRYGYHLSFGKVDSTTYDPQWNYGRTLASLNVAKQIEAALAAQDVYQRIEALKPTHWLYLGLKRELARYRQMEQQGGWKVMPDGASIKSGMSDSRMPELRARLQFTGDLDPGAVGTVSDPLVYDPATEEAVRRYQARMGLTADGVVGAGTIAEMNVTPAARIRQLRVNLDRGRVLLHDLPPKFVVANVAGFTVHLVEGDKFVWNSRVQVGKPYRETPIFRSEISYLVFNPTWTVPPGIIAKDILPAAKRDPHAITRKGLKVIDRSGREIDPASVDWSRFSGGNIPYTLRQDPGPGNALGRVKLMFPNPYMVYLHDTPSQSLFDRADRAFSSGCVRVENALQLAEKVLNDPERWNQDTIASAVASEQLQEVTLKEKMPVLLTYWTAWEVEGGAMNFRRDIYGQDAHWAAALDKPFKLRKRPLTETAE